MTEEASFIRATLTPKGGAAITVHFNPVSLQYQVTNQMQQRGGGQQQHVSSSTGKLTMDLVFDTTHSGADVRVDTAKVAKLMEPGKDKKVKEVAFEWGAYRFDGTLESYKETIDFFAPSGIPMRAAVNLTLAATKEQVFRGGDEGRSWGGTTALRSDNTVEVPAAPATREGGAGAGAGPSPSDVAAQGGDPGAARGIGAMNGAESLRFGASAGLTVSGGITLGGPVAFATGGAGFGAGISAGGGISAGAGLSASAAAGVAFGASGGAGFGVSAGAGAGISAGASAKVSLGGGASAGVGAAQGAFAGLSVRKQAGTAVRLDVEKLLPPPPASGAVAAGAGASFAVGGRALAGAEGSIRADVGASAGFHARVTFTEG
jgi:hypothetical protein